jgi:hypothetical protein
VPDKSRLTSVDILIFIHRQWKDGYKQFPNLGGYTPVEVLARLPAKDERYELGEEGLKAVLREIE